MMTRRDKTIRRYIHSSLVFDLITVLPAKPQQYNDMRSHSI